MTKGKGRKSAVAIEMLSCGILTFSYENIDSRTARMTPDSLSMAVAMTDRLFGEITEMHWTGPFHAYFATFPSS